MTDRYQPLRDAIAARSWPVGDSFQRNMGLVAELLKERDALRAAVRGLLDALPSATTHPAIKAARAALAKLEGDHA